VSAAVPDSRAYGLSPEVRAVGGATLCVGSLAIKMSILLHTDKPWQAFVAEPHASNHIRSMITPDERCYLQWLVEERYTGAGAIVDAGPLLGGSTVAMAEGLRRNVRVPEPGKIGCIHSYDLFEYYPYMRGLFAGEPAKTPGDDLLPLFMAHTEPWRPFIQVYPGDVQRFAWNGGPIEILFIDLAKSWTLQAHLLREFFPHLIPGVSIVVQQDYFFNGCPWIHVVMEQLADYLTPVHLPDGPTLGFTFDKAIPADLLAIDYEHELSASDKRRLMERAVNRFAGAKRLVAMTAQATSLLSLDDVDGAVGLVEAVRRSLDFDPYVGAEFAQIARRVAGRLPGTSPESGVQFLRDLLLETSPETALAIGGAGAHTNDLAQTLSAAAVQAALRGPSIQAYPSALEARRLLDGQQIDFAVIDALPEHPWAVADLLALLPVLAPGAWVVLRDVSVLWESDSPRRGYGSHYLFETWPGEKRRDSPFGRVGAIRLPRDLSTMSSLVADALRRPWEDVPPREVCAAVPIGPRVTPTMSYSVHLIREAASTGRPIYLWGAGLGGQNALDLLQRHDVPVKGFVDRDPAKHGTIVSSLQVHPPSALDSHARPRPYLAVSGKFATDIAAGLQAGGWERDADYVVW
jgi:hypothetical protein